MFIAAARARKSILSNFQAIGYEPAGPAWRSISMAVKRDLQAQRLRPNVAVPPRRNLIKYLDVMFRETGSLRQTLSSLLHSGTWTSSGGSFKLADVLAFDFLHEADERLKSGETFRYLEIGGGWAGFRTKPPARSVNVAGLAKHLGQHLGRQAFLHITNLTPWHTELPEGVIEHPFITAAGLSALETQGIPRGTFDIIYSQAAAYFEPDLGSFVAAASSLLRDGGILIFNFRPEDSGTVLGCAGASGLILRKSVNAGGMNGVVIAFEKSLQAHRAIEAEGYAAVIELSRNWREEYRQQAS
ncbi:hypothetical protein [Rhizobium sp. P44RR-XXIV]|uniref:hypothetical protein n=1 Tax=Rhizobium sp. P44RR-XXIV TaxID=1921145 RepID=UPI0009879CFB|nr:hypothetical protein [Rhizobium sp. P44RR-XXIV]TIX93134.1 class I SAM-dependent methyltransferase [Rhizobium sp. P44RR-XXIV]